MCRSEMQRCSGVFMFQDHLLCPHRMQLNPQSATKQCLPQDQTTNVVAQEDLRARGLSEHEELRYIRGSTHSFFLCTRNLKRSSKRVCWIHCHAHTHTIGTATYDSSPPPIRLVGKCCRYSSHTNGMTCKWQELRMLHTSRILMIHSLRNVKSMSVLLVQVCS